MAEEKPSQAKADKQAKAQQDENATQPDGAALEAMAVQLGHNRAQFQAVNEEFLSYDHETAQEKGYLGYSPTGPGENDAPWGRTDASRLGTQGEFLGLDEG